MIPLKDYNPTRRRALVTMAIVAACIVIYFLVQPGTGVFGFGARPGRSSCSAFVFDLRHAAIPTELVHGRPLDERTADALVAGAGCPVVVPEASPHKNIWLSVLWSMFLHGSLLHIGGNMLFLWVFGNNIEDRLGPLRYASFYLVAGLVATATQVALDPSSPVPMIGASGAIAGVMGAYLVLYPKVRIRTLLVVFIFPFLADIRAVWLLSFWFVSQFFLNAGSGVAWGAHVGGFVFGAAAGIGWRARGPQRARRPY